MSLDKGVQHGKERRKPYRKSQRFDRTCRPGGTCDWCRSNRQHQARKERERANVRDDQ